MYAKCLDQCLAHGKCFNKCQLEMVSTHYQKCLPLDGIIRLYRLSGTLSWFTRSHKDLLYNLFPILYSMVKQLEVSHIESIYLRDGNWQTPQISLSPREVAVEHYQYDTGYACQEKNLSSLAGLSLDPWGLYNYLPISPHSK